MGEQFQGARNLNNHIVTDILKKAANEGISFTPIGSYCKEIKNMRQLKEFARLVGASSWGNAWELYLEFASESVLEKKFKASHYEGYASYD